VSVIEYDVIVIGAGVAGLTAGSVLAGQGRKVALVAAGEPTACLSTGCIDVCSQDENPFQGIARLPDPHPFHWVSSAALHQALGDFQQMMAAMNMPYTGSVEKNRRVLSAIGTFKTTCLVPVTMQASPQSDDEKIHIVTFTGLKDFYPGYILSRLEKRRSPPMTPACPPPWALPPISKTTIFWKPSFCGWSVRKSEKIKLPFPRFWAWNRRRPS
jgi:glycerol-3-phosphate dehydrogenase subunit B